MKNKLSKINQRAIKPKEIIIDQDLELIEDPIEDSLYMKQKQKTNKNIYLLQCEQCNGDYCETSHWSAYNSIKQAIDAHKHLVEPKHLKGKDATNEWEEKSYEKGVLEFRTGNWGYIVWSIREIPFYITLDK